MTTLDLDPRAYAVECVPFGQAPAAGACHLWAARIDGHEDHWRDTLEPSELAAVAPGADRVRGTTVTSWGLQRLAGAHYLGTSPRSVRIERHCATCGDIHHGRPRWVDANDLDYSTSHSGGWVVLAVVGAGRVGLDLQLPSEVGVGGALDDLANAVMTNAELACYRGLPDDLRADYVCRMWVRKEAALKVTGHGLAVEPFTVDVRGVWTAIPSLSHRAPTPGLPQAPEEMAAPIHLRDVAIDRGYRAALASTCALDRVMTIRVHPDARAR